MLSSVLQYEASRRTDLAAPGGRFRGYAPCRQGVGGMERIVSEWVGDGKPWPVLKSAQDVEREASQVVDQSATKARDADEGSPLGEPDQGSEGEG